MPLDPKKLKESSEAHKERLKDGLWAEDPEPLPDDLVAAAEALSGSAEPFEASPLPLEADSGDLDVRGDAGRTLVVLSENVTALQAQVKDLARAVTSIQVQGGGSGPPPDVPAWLLAAAGDPKTYDAPDPKRRFVGWRVKPSTHNLLKQTQARFELRTLAGTLEFLVRLGAAASSGLPAHGTSS